MAIPMNDRKRMRQSSILFSGFWKKTPKQTDILVQFLDKIFELQVSHFMKTRSYNVYPAFCDGEGGGSDSHIHKHPLLWRNPAIHRLYCIIKYVST